MEVAIIILRFHPGEIVVQPFAFYFLSCTQHEREDKAFTAILNCQFTHFR